MTWSCNSLQRPIGIFVPASQIHKSLYHPIVFVACIIKGIFQFVLVL